MKALLILLLFSTTALHPLQDEATRKKHYNHQNGLAVEGYDVVSYFYGEPKKGNKANSYIHKGITYYFSSGIYLDLFKKNPEKYEPQYGGWCAYAMGNDGSKVEVDPETYKLLDGKLYLFYNAFFNNTKKTWDKNEANLKAKADKNWAAILNK
jgi:YHS domain-containing protein